MTNSRRRYYRWLYGTAALYDIVLGVVFLFFPRWAFESVGILEQYPTEGYIQLIGAFVLVLGVGYFLIWRGDLWRNRDLVLVGALYKLAYSGVAFWIALTAEAPHWVFVWGFGVADAIFLALMVECLYYVHGHRPDEPLSTRPTVLEAPRRGITALL
jgi:hypothetical protein